MTGGTALSPVMAAIYLFIFVSLVGTLLLHALGYIQTPGAPPWYEAYEVSYLIVTAVCAVGMAFRKPLALFAIAIVMVADVVIEISVLGEWDPVSIGVALMMIFFLLSNLKIRTVGSARAEKQ